MKLMVSNTILFDIDRTLIDNDSWAVIRGKRIAEAAGIKPEEYRAANDQYKASLENLEFFEPREMSRFTGEKLGVNADLIYKHYMHPAVLLQSKFPDVDRTLRFFKEQGFHIGIYSAAVHKDFQLAKLKGMQIFDYFESDLIFIDPNKESADFMKKIPPSIIVEDSLRILRAINGYEKILSVFINRKNKEIDFPFQGEVFESLKAFIESYGPL